LEKFLLRRADFLSVAPGGMFALPTDYKLRKYFLNTITPYFIIKLPSVIGNYCFNSSKLLLKREFHELASKLYYKSFFDGYY
jgi:hypothetical protein